MGGREYARMKRFIVIAENSGYKPSDGRKLIETLRIQGLKVVDVRIASKHIEIDVLSTETPILKGFDVLEVVEIGDRLIDCDDAFKRAVELFNAERFWEAHETLEPLWRKAEGYEKQLLHGLILTAAAFVHLQKNDTRGFHSILQRALKNLSIGHQRYRNIDMDELRKKINNAMSSKTVFKLTLT